MTPIAAVDLKPVLRISSGTTAFDTEINDLIAAARNDLILAGIIPEKVNDDTDPLIKRAVIVYVKANFGFDNPDAEKLQQSYDLLKMHLALAQDYNAYAVTFTIKKGVILLEDAEITFGSEKKITNSSGIAIFTGIRLQQNIKYTVKLAGYIDATGTVDVESSKSVTVQMTAVV